MGSLIALFTIVSLMLTKASAQGCEPIGKSCVVGLECCSKHCRIWKDTLGLSTAELINRKLFGECDIPCKGPGEECFSDLNCCSGMKCSLATDVEPVRKCFQCKTYLESCKVSSDCCDGDCRTLGQLASVCLSGCKIEGEFCEDGIECCDGNCPAYPEGSIFQGRHAVCGDRCNSFGEECRLPSDCCSGNCHAYPEGSIFQGRHAVCGL